MLVGRGEGAEVGAVVGGSSGAVIRAGRLTVVVGDPDHPFGPDDRLPAEALELVDRLCCDEAWDFEAVAGSLHAFVVEHDPAGVAALLESGTEAMVFLFDAAEAIEFETDEDPTLSQRAIRAQGRTGWTTELVTGPMISLGLRGSSGTPGWSVLRSGAVAGDVAVTALRQPAATSETDPATPDTADRTDDGTADEHGAARGTTNGVGGDPGPSPADGSAEGTDPADFDDEELPESATRSGPTPATAVVDPSLIGAAPPPAPPPPQPLPAGTPPPGPPPAGSPPPGPPPPQPLPAGTPPPGPPPAGSPPPGPPPPQPPPAGTPPPGPPPAGSPPPPQPRSPGGPPSGPPPPGTPPPAAPRPSTPSPPPPAPSSWAPSPVPPPGPRLDQPPPPGAHRQPRPEPVPPPPGPGSFAAAVGLDPPPPPAAGAAPPVGFLVEQQSGVTHVIAGPTVVGSDPGDDAEVVIGAASMIAIDDPSVHEVHVRINVVGRRVSVEDAGFGDSYVQRGDGPMTAIGPTPEPIDPGTLLRLGARTFIYRATAGGG